MADSENRYVEIAIDHPGHRGIIIPVAELSETIKRHTGPLFRTLYSFDEEILKHFEIRKTIKNYRGKYYLDQIILDIDKGDNTDEHTHEKTKDVIDRMINEYELDPNTIKPWFSGTGYHIAIPDIFGLEPDNNLPDIVKSTMQHYFPESDNIYDGSRLIRLGYTPNEKTSFKYYKTPFTIQEIFKLSYEEIKETSKEPRSNFSYPKVNGSVITQLLKTIERAKPKTTLVSPADIEKDYSGVVTCVQKMIAEGPVEGSRHDKIMRITSAFMRKGVPLEYIVTANTRLFSNMNAYEVERHTVDTFNKGYRFGCHDYLFDKYCDKKCIYYKQKIQGGDIITPIANSEELERMYVDAVRRDHTKQSINLANLYTLEKDYWIYPGEMIIIYGDTGMGKTAWVQNLCTDIGLNILFLSLEVSPDLMYRRFIQISTGKSKTEVDDHYKVENNAWSSQIKHITVGWVPPALDKVKELVAEVNPAVLVIDTIDCLKVNSYVKDQTLKMDMIIDELRAVATQQDIILIGVSHITKSDARGGSLDVHSGKHSSSIAQKADKVISITGLRDSLTRVISSLKARDEGKFVINCTYDPKNFRFKQQ